MTHMRQLWERTGFVSPVENVGESADDEEAEDSVTEGQQEGQPAGSAVTQSQTPVLSSVPVAEGGDGGGHIKAGERGSQNSGSGDSFPPAEVQSPNSFTYENRDSDVDETLKDNIFHKKENNSSDDSLVVSFASQDLDLSKNFPSIQEKLDKFEPEDIKRKAENSPELSKKEKKKLKNQEKHQRKQEQQEKTRSKLE